MSSPWVRIVLVPQTTMPTLRGYSPSCSARYFSISRSAACVPTFQAVSVGIVWMSML